MGRGVGHALAMDLNPLSLEHVSEIAAPPDQVWACIADVGRRPSWMTELTKVEAGPGLVSTGDRFTGRSSLLLHDFIGKSEVTKAEPGRILTEEVVIGARFVSHWEVVETEGGGSSVRHEIDVEYPNGPFSPVERWVLRRRLVRMQRDTLRNLARQFQVD